MATTSLRRHRGATASTTTQELLMRARTAVGIGKWDDALCPSKPQCKCFDCFYSKHQECLWCFFPFLFWIPFLDAYLKALNTGDRTSQWTICFFRVFFHPNGWSFCSSTSITSNYDAHEYYYTLTKFNIRFPKGISYSRVPFSGSMLNFRRVMTCAYAFWSSCRWSCLRIVIPAN